MFSQKCLFCLGGGGWGNGQEEGLYEKTTPIKFIHLYNNLERLVFLKKADVDINLRIISIFLPNTTMVRMVHTNHFYEISLPSDPKIKCSTQTHLFEK